MFVQACLNGARPPGFHPRLPLTPAALAADARACVAAGAAVLHLHPRGEDGRESLAPDAVGAALRAVRAAVPGVPAGISTGDWIEGDDARRLRGVAGWAERPDYASVNLSEAGAPAVIGALLAGGIGVEAGLASVADAERLVALGVGPRCLRVLIELGEQDAAEAARVAEGIEAALARGGIDRPVLLHGLDATVWAFVARAARSGVATRVGLEDGRTLPDGSVAADNAALVRAAVDVMVSRGGRGLELRFQD